jgi:hypothetical protein
LFFTQAVEKGSEARRKKKAGPTRTSRTRGSDIFASTQQPGFYRQPETVSERMPPLTVFTQAVEKGSEARRKKKAGPKLAQPKNQSSPAITTAPHWQYGQRL